MNSSRLDQRSAARRRRSGEAPYLYSATANQYGSPDRTLTDSPRSIPVARPSNWSAARQSTSGAARAAPRAALRVGPVADSWRRPSSVALLTVARRWSSTAVTSVVTGPSNSVRVGSLDATARRSRAQRRRAPRTASLTTRPAVRPAGDRSFIGWSHPFPRGRVGFVVGGRSPGSRAYRPRLPGSRCEASGRGPPWATSRSASPVTVAGPRRIRTGFPDHRPGRGPCYTPRRGHDRQPHAHLHPPRRRR